jgi:chromosome partitioning protein
MRILSFVSQKGGVSKTTSAVNVAACLALEHHKRVLLIDLDPQGSSTVNMGYEPEKLFDEDEDASLDLEDVEELDPNSIKNPNMYHVMMGKKTLREILLPTNIKNLTLAPADIVLAMADVYLPGRAGWDRILEVELDAVKEDYDYCLIDSPPSFGVLSQSALITAETVIVPLQCQFLSIRALKQLMRVIRVMIQRVKPKIDMLVFRTMFDGRLTQAKRVSKKIQKIAGDRMLETLIHQAADLQTASSKRQSVFELVKNRSNRAASEYRSLTKEILDYVEAK